MNDYVRKAMNEKIARVEAAAEETPILNDPSFSWGWNSAMASIKEALEKDER